MFYHGVSRFDRQYRNGILLLDLDNPAKVSYRSKYPLLEPTETYEQEGLVNNVTFPCGAVLRKNKIYLYYGAADKVIGLAFADLDLLLKEAK